MERESLASSHSLEQENRFDSGIALLCPKRKWQGRPAREGGIRSSFWVLRTARPRVRRVPATYAEDTRSGGIETIFLFTDRTRREC